MLLRRLIPGPPAEVDPATVYRGADRRPSTGRPWVVASMIASADGSATLAGRSGGLGGPADRHVFQLLRSAADVVLVGAGTVRAEHYGPAGGEAPPPVAVVTRSLDLDPTARFFTDAVARPVVVTCETAAVDRRRRLEAVSDVVVAGHQSVDVIRAVEVLGSRGHRTVLCEGGPTLLGQVAAAGVLDELCLTVSPVVAGGDGPRILVGGPENVARPLQLVSALEAEGALFLRYVVA